MIRIFYLIFIAEMSRKFIIITGFFVFFFHFYLKLFVLYGLEVVKSLLILTIDFEHYLTCFFDRDFEYNCLNLNEILIFLK